MRDQEFLAAARPAMEDSRPLTVTIEIKDAWILVAMIQMACRHPSLNNKLRRAATSMARQYQAAIVEQHPEAETAIEMGWNKRHDR